MPARDYRIGSLARGLAVLDCFAVGPARMTLSAVSAEVGLDKATTFRILQTLQAAGYVSQDRESKTYSLTLKVLDLQEATLAALDYPRRAQPLMEELSRSLGESVSIGVLEGTRVRYVARVSHRRIINTDIQVGTVLPAHATSIGKVLLAARGAADVRALYAGQALPRLTSKTIGTIDELIEQLASVAAQGYAVADGELEPGQWGASVPVFGRAGDLIAALCVASLNVQAPDRPGPAERLQHEFLPQLRATSASISRLLGYPARTHRSEDGDGTVRREPTGTGASKVPGLSGSATRRTPG